MSGWEAMQQGAPDPFFADQRSEVEVHRVDGRYICPHCGKEAKDHPQDPDNPWPTFVVLCDGRHVKV